MNFVSLKQGVEKLESAWHMKCTENFETFIILIAEIIAITACDLSWRLQANAWLAETSVMTVEPRLTDTPEKRITYNFERSDCPSFHFST